MSQNNSQNCKDHTPITFEQAQSVMLGFAAMPFFPSEPEARGEITDAILTVVNPINPAKPIKCKYSPSERLDWLRKAMRRVSGVTGKWPGVGELEAIYGMMFPPGDGIERPSPVTPGFTQADHENGTDIPLLPRTPEETLSLPAGEQMTEEERKQLADQFSGALAVLAPSNRSTGEVN